jgi:hypothetical protein
MISIGFAATMAIGVASGGVVGYSTGHPRVADASRPVGIPQGTACPAQGPGGEPLIGLGATIGVFRASFGPQSKFRLTDFGEQLAAGPNQGERQFGATCSPSGHVLTMTWNLPTTLSVDAVKVNLLLSGLIPADSTEVRHVAHASTCELLIFRSPTLAKEMSEVNPTGVMAAEMTGSPTTAFDPDAVSSVLLTMNENATC